MNIKNLCVALAVSALPLLATPAMAHTAVYTADLSKLGEPAPADLSLGTGTATVTLDLDAFTMRVQASFSNLTGNTTASHIHCCTALANAGSAGVATVTPSFTSFPLGVKSGTYDYLYNLSFPSAATGGALFGWNTAFINANGGTASSAFAALATGLDSGKAYLNIHTSFVGGGEIRGFLVAAPVPEPETYGMLLAGLALVGALARRRKQTA